VIIKAFFLTRCNFILLLLGSFWLSAIAAFAYLATYDLTPGNKGVEPSVWPAASGIVPARNKCNAVVFLHPRCFCSLATANELAKIMSREENRLKVHVIVRPTRRAEEASASSSTSSATTPAHDAQLSIQDSNSRLIKTIDSLPGHVLLFGANGNLIFAGGITASRGHEGDNLGADAMLKAMCESRRSTVSTTPVFGCSLEEI
jgi:hypothetical protein